MLEGVRRRLQHGSLRRPRLRHMPCVGRGLESCLGWSLDLSSASPCRVYLGTSGPRLCTTTNCTNHISIVVRALSGRAKWCGQWAKSVHPKRKVADCGGRRGVRCEFCSRPLESRPYNLSKCSALRDIGCDGDRVSSWSERLRRPLSVSLCQHRAFQLNCGQNGGVGAEGVSYITRKGYHI